MHTCGEGGGHTTTAATTAIAATHTAGPSAGTRAQPPADHPLIGRPHVGRRNTILAGAGAPRGHGLQL